MILEVTKRCNMHCPVCFASAGEGGENGDIPISEIEKQTDYLFVYNVNEVNLKRNVKVNAQNKSVAEVLNKVFEGTDIYYAMEGKNIMLMSKAKDGEVAQQANKVTGIVKDTNGER